MNQNKKPSRNELDNNTSFMRLGLLFVLFLGVFAYMYFTGVFEENIDFIESKSTDDSRKEEETEATDEYTKIDIEEETDLEIPFSVIEEVPVFPGCKGSKADKRNCLSKKIRKHVSKHFNTELANELGLSRGKKRIYVRFKIDKNGNVTDIHAKAPHPKLKKEGIRIISKLPKLIPGIHHGKAVSVAYTLPITFSVD